MTKSAFSHVMWRSLGGVFGVAVLVSMAFAIGRIAHFAGYSGA